IVMLPEPRRIMANSSARWVCSVTEKPAGKAAIPQAMSSDVSNSGDACTARTRPSSNGNSSVPWPDSRTASAPSASACRSRTTYLLIESFLSFRDREPAVHPHDLPGDERGPVREEELDDFGDLGRLGETLQRMPFPPSLRVEDTGGDRLFDHRGVDVAGSDRVDAYPVGRPFHRQGPGEGTDRCFGHRVRQAAGPAEVHGDRSEVDDGSTGTGRDHETGRRLGGIEGSVEVAAQDVVPLIGGHVETGTGMVIAGGVDETDDAAARRYLGHRIGDRLVVGNVTRERPGSLTQRLGRGREGGGVEVDQPHDRVLPTVEDRLCH